MNKHNPHSNTKDNKSNSELDNKSIFVEDNEIENKIEKLMKFFDDAGIDYSKFNPENVLSLNLSTKAYPNNDMYVHAPSQYDTKKWLDAVKNIYQQEKDGINRIEAIKKATSGWKITETYNFLNWIKFYEAGDHLKYKFAQLWYENGAPGYFLHIKKDAPQVENNAVSNHDIDFAKDTINNNSEKKQLIEKQRNKIIGRLDSAEKLLRSPDGQIFSGEEFENLLESIYQLKKKIQMVNKISSSIKLYEDMIIREANILTKRGFSQASNILHSIAQNTIPNATSPGDPSGAGNPGAPGGLPSMGPGMSQNAPSSSVPGSAPNENSPTSLVLKKDKPKAITDFLEGMNTSKLTVDENHNHDENIEILDNDNSIDVVESDDLLKSAQAKSPIDEPMTSAPAPASLTPTKTNLAPPESTKNKETDTPLEISEDEVSEAAPAEKPSLSQFDARIDEVFSEISVEDVIAKLEDLSKIFKTRELPRQLSMVDMMLDSLGMASFFPSLAEATNKALESNNYISTRVEDILSKLRGQISTRDIDLRGNNAPERPDLSGLKNKLKQDEEKEKARKQQRKEQEQAELDGSTKETPEIEINEDLAPAPAPTAEPAKAPLAAPPLTK